MGRIDHDRGHTGFHRWADNYSSRVEAIAMTPISQMTDADLQRTIAEKLGYWWGKHRFSKGFLRRLLRPPVTNAEFWEPTDDVTIPEMYNALEYAPNWPGDVAAAMELLDEFDDVGIEKDGPDRWVVDIHSDSLVIIGSGDASTLARAICVAWLTARGNDG